MGCSIPGFPVLYYLWSLCRLMCIESASHPLSPPSPPALNIFQHQSLFQDWFLHNSGFYIKPNAKCCFEEQIKWRFSYCCLVAKLYPNALQPHGLQPGRLLCPWDFPSKNMGVGCCFLLQKIFPTQGSNPHLLQGQADSYHWATWETSLVMTGWKPRAYFPVWAILGKAGLESLCWTWGPEGMKIISSSCLQNNRNFGSNCKSCSQSSLLFF